MATQAGQITNTGTATVNPQWVPCDGKVYVVTDPKRQQRTPIPNTPSTGDRRDYLRRVGNQGRERGLGGNGFIIQVPVCTGYSVSLADDNTEAALGTNYTVQKPPPGTSG